MKNARGARSGTEHRKSRGAHRWQEILARDPAHCPARGSKRYRCRQLENVVRSGSAEDGCAGCEAFWEAVQEDLQRGTSPEEIIGFLANEIRLMQEREAKTGQQQRRNEHQLTQTRGELQRYRHQIQQAEKLASVGELAAGVAHEINNPLAGILTFAKLALRKLSFLDEAKCPHCADVLTAIADYMERIVQEDERCSRIIRQLLDFSRPKSVEPEALDINQLLRRVLALVRERARTQGTVITERFTFNLPHVWGDADQLQQVFLNVLINAIQAMPSPELLSSKRTSEIRIVSKYEAGKLASNKALSDGEAVLVQVSDNGCGIPPDDLHKVFNPFFTTKEQGQSTGLGLSVAYNIVQTHGGQITVESTLGVGTTISVLLPVGAEGEG